MLFDLDHFSDFSRTQTNRLSPSVAHASAGGQDLPRGEGHAYDGGPEAGCHPPRPVTACASPQMVSPCLFSVCICETISALFSKSFICVVQREGQFFNLIV